jgi:hypothetical protein
MSKDFNFAADVSIDPDNLDQECLEHAGRYQRYSEEMAKAKVALEKGKRELEVTLALVELAIRRGEGKLTEAMVKALVTTDPRTQLAYEKYYDIKKEYEILNTAVSAFEHRRTNLSDLVRLHAQSYFSSPEARPLVRERKKKQEDNDLTDKAMEILRKAKIV